MSSSRATPDSTSLSSVGLSTELPLADSLSQTFPEGPGSQNSSSVPDDRVPMGRRDWLAIRNVVLALIVFGLGVRLTALGNRPLHHDESLDAWFSWRFLNGSFDGYDPIYHGPLRFYLTAAVFWLIGESEATARLLAALTGAAVVGLPWLWRKDLGQGGVVAAVGLLAVSPSMLYFSRVGREDTPFLLLTFTTVLLFVAFLRAPRAWHPVAILASVVASMAIKESTFITVFILGGLGLVLFIQDFLLAMPSSEHAASKERNMSEEGVKRVTLLVGLVLLVAAFSFGEPIFLSLGIFGATLSVSLFWAIWVARSRGADMGLVPVVRSLAVVSARWWLAALLISSLLFVALFTQFFSDFSGPPDSFSAPYGSIKNGLFAGFEYWRGEQDTVRGDSRWQYYLAVVPAYEWFILALSAVGISRVLICPNLVGQTLIWWGVASFAAYSWAGERMPWLMIHPFLPFVLLAGIGVNFLWGHRRKIWITPIAIAASLGLLWTLNTSYLASFERGGEPQELFVQAGQATPEVPDWADRLYALDRLVFAEEGRHLTVSIDSDVYWPYGWYLRDFPTGTYAVFNEDSSIPDTDVVFLPHWEQASIGGQLIDHALFPYEHRWWWVPDFDVGFKDWALWVWDRTPWDGSESDISDCPGSLVGGVYVRKSLLLLEQEYFGPGISEVADKPAYGGPCERVSSS